MVIFILLVRFKAQTKNEPVKYFLKIDSNDNYNSLILQKYDGMQTTSFQIKDDHKHFQLIY